MRKFIGPYVDQSGSAPFEKLPEDGDMAFFDTEFDQHGHAFARELRIFDAGRWAEPNESFLESMACGRCGGHAVRRARLETAA